MTPPVIDNIDTLMEAHRQGGIDALQAVRDAISENFPPDAQVTALVLDLLDNALTTLRSLP